MDVGNLIVDIQAVAGQGLDLRFHESADRFPALQSLHREEGVCFSGPIAAEIQIVAEETLYRVRGRLAAAVDLPCGRCLAPFRLELAETFDLTYTDRLPDEVLSSGFPDSPMDLTADDMGLAWIRDGRIDLAETLQEQLIMALPMRPLCRKDCRGLCPGCGADLNRQTCRCSGSAPDPRFAILAKLKNPRNTS